VILTVALRCQRGILHIWNGIAPNFASAAANAEAKFEGQVSGSNIVQSNGSYEGEFQRDMTCQKGAIQTE
jgi:hypothetical protein